MFNRISARYDFLNTIMTAGRHHVWRKIAAGTVVDGSMNGTALDVAAGTGDFIMELAQSDYIVDVVGIDFAPDMVLAGGEKICRAGIGRKVSYLLGDAHLLPFAARTFMCVTVGFGVRNFMDATCAISETFRVLRPGGRMAILEIVRIEDGAFRHLFRFYFKRVTPWLGAILARDREAYTYLPESVEKFYSARELSEIMHKEGFEEVSIRRLAFGSVAIISGRRSRNS